MTTISPSFQAYKMALALNNMSLVLFQQGSLPGALKTCNDARSVLQAVMNSSSNDNNSSSEQEDPKRWAKKKCEQARKRLAKQIQLNRERGLTTTITSLEQNQDDTAVVPYQELQDNDHATLQYITEHYASSWNHHMIFPVRLSEAALCATPEQVSGPVVAHQLGLILYNQGLYHGAATTTNNDKVVQQHRQAANKSLAMAQTIFGRLAHEVVVEQEEEQQQEKESETALLAAPLFHALSGWALSSLATASKQDTAVKENKDPNRTPNHWTTTPNDSSDSTSPTLPDSMGLALVPNLTPTPTPVQHHKAPVPNNNNNHPQGLLHMTFYNASQSDLPSSLLELPITTTLSHNVSELSLREILDHSNDI
mmetsp:Transcript_19329/g.41599  ORF Transcript_19329/g.41599 Transcript_19329/m.41599 type:complete len:367 (+) Transcript_19329:146-1246(+)|eukprot:CAMPEP_0168745668 /NCGR_PEP_ID=MMETSP0724-20121128/14740_1 /TAXON_ID=265536 /ORGANISM="Amphiprora sp., Strain CCMP467" /LENGTH=366 /DNA_ID=CAMNT_0008793395 /DNA_START=140 /DNA_END=1240 /DNA_ORIENTATION=-